MAGIMIAPKGEELEERALLSENALVVNLIRITEPGGDLLAAAQVDEFQFNDLDRWDTTFINGSGLTQGDATTLRWGIVPEGAAISAGNQESASGSSLIQFMDSLYGDNGVPDNGDLTQKPWFTIFSSSLDRISQLSGLTYTYLAINGLPAASVSIADSTTNSAIIPEILIGGHSIDGQSGSNTLAYNYFPGTGDMVIDTDNTSFFGNATNSSRGMRNVLIHEFGHGIGLDHVESSDGQFIMEPFVSTAFDGPQFDDILALQRGYGDVLEKNGGNNTSGTATSLGSISPGGTVSKGTSASNSTVVAASATDFVSIDDESDVDFFSFTVGAAGTATLTLTPKGPVYQQGPEGGAQSSFNAAAQGDLMLQLLGTNGSTVLQTVNVNGLGGTEVITNAALSSAGTYFARVSGTTTNAIQLYQLDVSFSASAITITANNAGGNGAGNGTADAFRLVQNGANLEVYLNNTLSQSLTLTSVSSILVQGSGDNDRLTVDYTGGLFNRPITFTGAGQTSAPGDSLVILDAPGTATNVTHTFTNANDGSVDIDGVLISYTGLAPITDNVGATNRVFTFNGGAETITVTDGTASDGKTMIDSTLGESVYFVNPSGSLTINAGTGDDSVTITTVDAASQVDLTIDGGAGSDTVNLNADVITFSANKSLAVTAEAVALGTNADLVTSGSGTITLTADNISIANTAALVSASAVTLQPQTVSRAINLGTETSGQLSLTDAELDRITAGTLQIGTTSSTIDVTAAIDLTEGPSIPTTVLLASGGVLGSGGNILKANALDIQAAGGIGISGDPLVFDAITLTTDSSNVAVNNQFLRESNSVTISSSDLDAGTSSITLANGTFLTSSTGSIQSAVTVASGATLGGTGTTAAVTVQSGGKVAPGVSPGILKSGNVVFTSGSAFDVEIGGTTAGNAISNHDQLNVTGTVSLGNANLNLSAFNNFVPVAGNRFTILVNDGSDAITGTFNGLAEGATISNFLGSGLDATISYVANSDGGSVGNDVVLRLKSLFTPALSINDPTVSEGNSGTSTLTFTVKLSAAATSPFTVQFATQDGTATVSNNDYVPIGPNSSLRIGSFDGSRGGIFSLSDGASAAAMRTAIQSNFSGATISGTSTLTASFLANIDVLWLNSVSSNTTATTALTSAEQTALLNFVKAGGGVLIFGENGFFDDESLLDPFGATSTGSLTAEQTGTIINTSHPVTNGSFGTVRTIGGNYPGNLTTLGSATSLGTWNSGGQSSMAVIDPGVLSVGSGRVVLFSDVNFYSDQLAAADNSKLMLNALAATQPANRLTFSGTAGETKTIQVTVIGDTQVEPNETLSVVLSNIGGNDEVIIADGTGFGTITNDDIANAQSTLSISDALVAEGNSGTTTLTFNVTLSAATSTGFTVQFATQDGTATVANNDYVPIAASSNLRIGSFDASRGGIFSLSNGANSAAMRSSIQSNFSGATITGTSTLTASFLSNVDVLWLNSVSSNTSATTALTSAEQTALLNFVNAGGGVLIFGENGFFDDESLLDPFGVTSTGSLTGEQSGTINNTSHPVTNGAFGTVRTIGGNFPGNLTTLGSATSLGTWNSSGQSSVAVIDPGVLSSGSGRVVLFSDVNFYGDQLATADNSKLLLNALAATQTPNRLTFAGTAGETKTIQVTVIGDTQVEPNETLNVLLSNLSGNNQVTIADGTGVGTITNDENSTPPPTPTPPVVNDQSFSINENSAINAMVGTVVATDPGDVLTYSILSGNTSGTFAINASTGQLTVLNSAALDFETTPTFQLTVKVQDAGGLSDTALITINLNNEQASLSINDVSQAEGNSGTTTMTFTVTLSGTTSSSFRVPFQSADGTATTANNDYVPLSSSGSLVIGAFNSTRGGTFGLADGANAAAMRSAILTSFPGATIVGTDTLSSAFLATVNVVWLNSVAGNTGATSPLSQAEQTALLNFVNAGGGAIVFGEHSFFDDSSFLSPFGLVTASGLSDINTGTITNTTHPVTAGPFGNVTTISANYPGNFTGLGSATSLGTWNGSGLSALAVLNSGSGKVVALTDVNLYAERLNQAGHQNRELLLNALAFTKPAGDLQFIGTAGEKHTIHVTINGDSQFEPSETFNVLLTGVTGSNDVTILKGTGNGTIQNDDAIAVLQVSDALVSERTGNSANAVFTVTLSSPSSQAVTVNYSTSKISSDVIAAYATNPLATSGKDFQPKSGTLRFAPGQLSQTISVPVLDDTLHEGDETFFVQLNSATGATITDGIGLATIHDNDAAPTVTINDVTVTERTNSSVNALFTVKLSAASALSVTVDYSTTADSATAGADYQSSRGTINFNPGETAKTITVVTSDDLLHEANEVFFVNLTNSKQAAILDGQGRATIKDNDKAPLLSIKNAAVIEGATAVFTINLSAPSGQPVTVAYTTTNASAAGGTLTFAAGETTKTIRVDVAQGAISSSSKTLKVNLNRAVNALFTDRQGLATILDNH